MEDLTNYWTIGSIIFAAASEIIGMLPIKSNSVIQLVLSLGAKLFRR
jgi:hypothetical protein